jgi:ribulose-phosphate 3-epimerase
MIRQTGRSVDIEVDGGIDAERAAEVVAAGANVLVAGTAVFRHPGGVKAGIDAIRAACLVH